MIEELTSPVMPKRLIWWLITANTTSPLRAGRIELAHVEVAPSLSLGVYL